MIKNKYQKKALIVQVAALGYDFLREHHDATWRGLTFKPINSAFPALTCAVQATFRTASLPQHHGMIANGLFIKNLMRPFFWEQSAALVTGKRIWEDFRMRGKKVGLLFWQQSLGESADCLLSPAPVHKHHGGMIQDCYSYPEGLYDKLCGKIGRRFDLMRYWGPMASSESSEWIAEATCNVISDPDIAPDLCLTYLPVLDYDLQRYGPGDSRSIGALTGLFEQLEQLAVACEAAGYELMIFGDYAIGACGKGAVYPNKVLRDAGLFAVRNIRGMLYPDFYRSRAFAVADHEIAHVYVKNRYDLDKVLEALKSMRGIGVIMDHEAQARAGLAHANSGDLVIQAEDGYWFAYPWWNDRREAPDYAGHVDIHNKPGYDPCELFWGWPPGSVSKDPSKIGGSHGLTGPNRRTCWASTFIKSEPDTIVGLAEAVRTWLEEDA